jgi:pimeloyl-ACP methyl ester carboxylesterase
MIELPLPPGVERLLVETPRRRIQALHGVPRPEADNGIDVVMVSGFFGTKEDFREVMSLLAAAGYRGWAYDYSGQLELTTAGEVGYSIADMASDLTELIREVTGGRPVHLVGHCLGGFVARSAAVAEPGLARSLALVACGPDMQEEKHQSMLEGLAKLHANGGTIALWPLVKALLAKDDTVMHEFWHAKLSEMNPRWVTGTAESMADEPDRSDELAALGIASLVVFGKRDRRVWSHDTYAGMAGRLRAGHVIIPKASHSPNMEQPALLAEALLEFWTAEDAYEGEPAAVA